MDANLIIVILSAVLIVCSAGWILCFHRWEKEEKDLKRQLAHHKKRIALMDATDLPKCKSVACYNCKHCAWLYNPGSTAIYLLGCGKDLKCKDFEFTGLNKPPAWERETEMLTAEEKGRLFEENPLDSSKRQPFQPIDSVPRPSCHQA